MERMLAMTRKTSKMPALTPAEKRLRNTHCKLRDALERLVKGDRKSTRLNSSH